MLLETPAKTIDLPAESLSIEASAAKLGGVPVRVVAYTGGVIDVPHMGGPMVFDMTRMATPGTIPLLVDHENSVRALAGSGVPQTDGRHLWANGTIAEESTAGREILAGHRGGINFQASVGVTPIDAERIRGGDTIEANGQSFTAPPGGLTIVRRSRLNEISFVAIGKDQTTSVAIAASHQPTEGSTMSASTTPTTELTTADVMARLDALDARFDQQRERREELVPILGEDSEILATAVDQGWTPGQAEAYQLRQSMPKSILANQRGSGDTPRESDVIEASLMVNAGSDSEDLKAHFPNRTIDAAMSGRMQGFGLQDLCRLTIRRSGKSLGVGGFSSSTIRAAFEADRDILAAGNSAYSLTGITNNAANKFALDGFHAAGSEWRQWCAIDSVKDFKEQSFYRLSAGTQYKELGVGEAIPMGSLSEESFTNAAKTHALMLSIPREVIINDDLGVVRTGARLHLGYGAGLTLAQIVYSQLLASAAVGSGKFFHTSHSDRGPNYKAGANSALSVEAVEDAVTMQLKQIDKEGNPIDVNPRFLLTGPDQAFLADRICKDEYAPNCGSTKREPTRNAMAGRLEPLMSRYLNHASVPGGSAATWFVLADPKALGTGAMQVVFLQGRQVPVLETSDADFRTLGIEMRGTYDFNAKLMEKACAVKFAGA